MKPKNRHLWKKENSRLKFTLVERRQKCHNLDDDRSLLRPGAFCSLQQLSSLIHAVVFLKMKCNVSSLKDEQKEAAVHFFRPKHVFTSFGDRLWGKSDTQLRAKSKNKANGANVVVLIVSPPKNILKEQREEMGEDSFHCFVNNRRRASADCRRSEIRKRKTFLNSKPSPKNEDCALQLSHAHAL